MKPNKLNILGKEYAIIYCDKPSDVDSDGRESYWGFIDHWKSEIRILKRKEYDMLETILHEVLHSITTNLKMKTITKADDEEEVIDLLAIALTDFLTRNKWIKVDDKSS